MAVNLIVHVDSENKIKILVIRLSSLGDVLLTTPVLRALKNKFPKASIHFLVKPQFADAIRYNPILSAVHEFDSNNTDALLKKIKEEKFNFVFDLQNNFRSRKFISRLGIKSYSFKKPSLKKWLLVKTKINLFKKIESIPEMYAKSIDNLELDSKGLELVIPGGIYAALNEDKNYFGFCPGSQHFTKRWPKEYFIELGNELQKIGFTVVCFGGKDDKDLCGEISAGIEGGINFQNENELFKTAAGMKKCKMILSNDSGLMHTAAASGVPVIAIFGSSVKEFGFMPYGIKNKILENNSLNCRPCSHIGRAECPLVHFKCMKDLSPGFVLDQIKKFLTTL